MDANELINCFIKSCSHDLRSPITSIKGLVNLAGYYAPNPETKECLVQINDCTNKMDSLLHSLQEFMEINTHEVVIKEEDCEQLLNNVLEDFQPALQANEIEITKKIEVPVTWTTDSFVFTGVLNHLVSNAIVFQNPEKPEKHINIQVKGTEATTILEVNDNGLGISTENQLRIFSPFFKAHVHSKGLGMGLFQVSHLAKKVKAKVSVFSHEGIGSSFKLMVAHK